MKKKILIIVIIISVIISLLIINVKHSKIKEISSQENSHQDKIYNEETNNNDIKYYDVNLYPKIKNISESFINLLKSKTVNFESINYEIGIYNENKKYKNVIIVLNEKENITMKYDDNGNLLVMNIMTYFPTGSIDYENSKLTAIQFDYYNFTEDEITNIIKYTITRGEKYNVGNYEISSFTSSAWSHFTIVNNMLNN